MVSPTTAAEDGGATGVQDAPLLGGRHRFPISGAGDGFVPAVTELATAHPASPVFVVRDEMNLARVEYYFSDVLSAIETGEAMHLHSNSVPLEGSTGTSIWAELPLPQNLYITGAVNVDETTNPVSNKVLAVYILTPEQRRLNMSRIRPRYKTGGAAAPWTSPCFDGYCAQSR